MCYSENGVRLVINAITSLVSSLAVETGNEATYLHSSSWNVFLHTITAASILLVT